MMGIKEDYQQAVELAKRGEYRQARALLLPYDNAKTNALLAKIETAIRSDSSSPTTTPPKKSIDIWTIAGVLFFLSIACLTVSFYALYVLNG